MKEVGVGTRVINFVVDTLLIFLLAYALYKWWSFYVRFWDYKFIPLYVFFYGSAFVYYTLFEVATSRTPGKWLSITKVRNVHGRRPAWYQVLFRSLLRLTLIDMFFIPFLDMPLHDALSKTRVVQAE